MADEASSRAETPTSTASKVTPQELLKKRNPALARLAAEVQKREEDNTVVSYSRMHHRHNRS